MICIRNLFLLSILQIHTNMTKWWISNLHSMFFCQICVRSAEALCMSILKTFTSQKTSEAKNSREWILSYLYFAKLAFFFIFVQVLCRVVWKICKILSHNCEHLAPAWEVCQGFINTCDLDILIFDIVDDDKIFIIHTMTMIM